MRYSSDSAELPFKCINGRAGFKQQTHAESDLQPALKTKTEDEERQMAVLLHPEQIFLSTGLKTMSSNAYFYNLGTICNVILP